MDLKEMSRNNSIEETKTQKEISQPQPLTENIKKFEHTEDFYQELPEEVRRYFKKRSKSCFDYSTFDCLRYNCKSCCTDNVGKEVTAFDIIAMALVSNLPITLGEEIVLKADIFEDFGSIKPTLQMATPCKFLSDEKCSIHKDNRIKKYVGKPLACVFFPENILAANQFLGERKREMINNLKSLTFFAIEDKGYPCLTEKQEKQKISEARFRTLLKLEDLFRKEQKASNLYFEIESHKLPIETPKKLDKRKWKSFINKVQEIFLKEFGKGTKFYSNIQEKISRLYPKEGFEELFNLLAHV